MDLIHVVVVWRLVGANATVNWAIDARLSGLLRSMGAIECMPGVHVAHGLTPGSYSALVQQIAAISSSAPAAVNVLVTPPIYGGVYQGWLPAHMWALLNGTPPGDRS